MDHQPVAGKRRTAVRSAGLILAGLVASSVSLLPSPADASGVYQWRDADGRLHFGDAPPEQDTAKNLSERYDNSLPFRIVIEGVDYKVPASVREHISISVKKIFTIYRQALGEMPKQRRDFRIVIYGNEADFRRYQRQVAPVLENAAGFYNNQTNQITTWGMAEAQLLALVTHEASHAISNTNEHWVPTWLNEGLAEYFEGMHVFGLSAEVHANRYWLNVLTHQGYTRRPPDLRRYLAVSHEQWYRGDGDDGTLAYATSWSLVYFLMDSRQGRDLLKALLERTRASPLPLMDSADFIDQRWPGGLAAFTEAWRAWLAGDTANRHRY